MMHFEANVVEADEKYYCNELAVQQRAIAHHSDSDSDRGDYSHNKHFPLPKYNDWTEWRRQIKALKLRKSTKAHNILIQADASTYSDAEQVKVRLLLGAGYLAQPIFD